MKKELLTVSTIIIATIVLSIYTHFYLKSAINEEGGKIDNIYNLAEQDYKNNNENNSNEIENKVNELSDEWNQKNKKLAIFVEHDELEKIDTSIVTFKEYLKLKQYEEALPELKKCRFILDHIHDKESLRIINLF